MSSVEQWIATAAVFALVAIALGPLIATMWQNDGARPRGSSPTWRALAWLTFYACLGTALAIVITSALA